MSRRTKPVTLNLREKARAAIRQGILDLRYPAGSLLSENQLAEELGISRTPIREALRELAAGGLVRILPRRGIVVSEPTVQDIVEVYQLREQLECFAAGLVAGWLAPSDAEAFQADHEEALAHMKAGRERKAYDASVRLHSRIVDLARNQRLKQFIGELGDQVHRFGLLTLRHGRAGSALAEHGEIIAALVRKDSEAAEALMRAHLRADRDIALRATLPTGFSAVELPGCTARVAIRALPRPGSRAVRGAAPCPCCCGAAPRRSGFPSAPCSATGGRGRAQPVPRPSPAGPGAARRRR